MRPKCADLVSLIKVRGEEGGQPAGQNVVVVGAVGVHRPEHQTVRVGAVIAPEVLARKAGVLEGRQVLVPACTPQAVQCLGWCLTLGPECIASVNTAVGHHPPAKVRCGN